jgi:hypothetical protein
VTPKVTKTQHQSPLSLIIHRVRFIKKPAKKSTLAFNRGMKLRKPSILVVN